MLSDLFMDSVVDKNRGLHKEIIEFILLSNTGNSRIITLNYENAITTLSFMLKHSNFR